MSFSVVILTLNEERSLPACLASLRAFDDVHVLDSGSTDRTQAIARDSGAHVCVNPFENFAQQRNHAHTAINFRHPWVFHLDADEALTPELIAECAAFADKNPSDLDGAFAAPRMLFRGRWIPRCTDFPAYQARFCLAARFRFVQTGHGQREAAGLRLACLKNNYIHNLSAQPEVELIAKHRRYARQEAAAHLARLRAPDTPRPSLFARDPLVRRRALKSLSQHLPCRGPLRFVYQYVLRCGLLDGRAGFAYCLLMARYEHWIAQEIRRQK